MSGADLADMSWASKIIKGFVFYYVLLIVTANMHGSLQLPMLFKKFIVNQTKMGKYR